MALRNRTRPASTYGIGTVKEELYLLAAVFHLADLTIRFQRDPKAALRHLHQWKTQGLIMELGGVSQGYTNLVVAKYPDWENALRTVMPSAVVMGVEALRRAGWSSQIPYLSTVAVDAGQTVYAVDHFDMETLPSEWFEQTAP